MDEIKFAMDTFYAIMAGALVMWMAAGFTMLEAGLVRRKNTAEIVTKNIQEEYELFFKYSYLEGVMKQIKKWELVILENNFNLDCRIKILVSKKKSDIVFDFFKNHKNIKIKFK